MVITADEEIGGANGARKALQDIQAEFCIALDGGSLKTIVTKEKGLVKLKLVAQRQNRPRRKTLAGRECH